MNQILQWITAMVQKLQPRQHASGSNTVQVEQAGRDVQIDNSSRQVTMHVTQVFYSAQVESEPAANSRATATTVSNEQREVLASIRSLGGKGESVFKFMERTFGSRMVIHLKPGELVRVQAYITTIKQRLATKPAEGISCKESA